MPTEQPSHQVVVDATAAAERTMSTQRVPVNVYETTGALVLVCPLPAVTARDVTIELRPGRLRFWAHLRTRAAQTTSPTSGSTAVTSARWTSRWDTAAGPRRPWPTASLPSGCSGGALTNCCASSQQPADPHSSLSLAKSVSVDSMNSSIISSTTRRAGLT